MPLESKMAKIHSSTVHDSQVLQPMLLNIKNEDQQKLSPILTAAHNGNYIFLKGHISNANIHLESVFERSEKNENILHLVLKRPLLAKGEFSDPKEKIKHLIHYMRCLNQLLNDEGGLHPQKLIHLVNQQDDEGNTPMHYAVKSWPRSTVEKLLAKGANIAIRNCKGKTPLSEIPCEVLEEYLDKHCVNINESKLKLLDYEDYITRMTDDDEKTDNDEITNDQDSIINHDDEKSVLKEMLGENEPTFMMNINDQQNEASSFEQSSITFNYNLLAPKHISSDSSPQRNSNLKFSYKHVCETFVLQEICESSKHENLLIHPVLTFFIWLKWCLLRKYLCRILRFHFLYTVCLTWYLLSRFDDDGTAAVTNSCFHRVLTIQWNDYICSTNHSTHINSTNSSFTLGPKIHDNNETSDLLPCYQYCSFGYFVFVVQFILQLYLLWNSSLKFVIKRYVFSKKSVIFEESGRQISTYSVLFSGIIDVLNTSAQLWVLIGGKTHLSVIISCYVSYLIIFEIFQFCATQKEYFFNLKHLFDWLRILMPLIIMYDTNNVICSTSVKRSFSAILLFLVWYNFMIDWVLYVSFSGTLERLKIYFLMIIEVSKSFLRILCLYSFFFIVFGLGFFLLLNTNSISKDSYLDPKNCSKSLYNSELSAIVKSFVMFTGEIEFSTMPITGNESHENENTVFGVILAYTFVIIFIFMVVIVLMNLLNAMAIRDTARIQKKSKVFAEKSRVKLLAYLEHTILSLLQFIKAVKGSFNNVDTLELEGFFSQEILLFHPSSSHSKEKKVMFHQNNGNEYLTIFCCGDPKCQFQQQDIKLKHTEKFDGILNATKRILIDRNKKTFQTFVKKI